MPTRTKPEVLIRAYLMRQQLGLKLDEIMKRLGDEFDEDDIPDKSTISRRLKSFRENVLPEELAEDVPFTWSTMSEVPWEGSRAVLEASWAYGELFTRRLAKWTWRVLQAFGLADCSSELFAISTYTPYDRDVLPKDLSFDVIPWIRARVRGEPTSDDIFKVALEYTRREIVDAIGLEAFDARAIDAWLAYQPWLDEARYERYQVHRTGIWTPSGYIKKPASYSTADLRYVKWHHDDVEYLSRVSPEAAQGVVDKERWYSEGKEYLLSEPDPELLEEHKRDFMGDEQFKAARSTEAWKQVSANLLWSQVEVYDFWADVVDSNEGITPDGRPPWYFKYLDEAIAAPESVAFRGD